MLTSPRNFTIILFSFLICYNINAQTGPGGVGATTGTSNLVLWTNPDDITESDSALFPLWSDASGYGSHLSQTTTIYQPQIKKNILNGYDIVRFDDTPNNDKRLQKTNFTNFPTTAISGFYVNKTADTGDGVLSYASTNSNNNFLIFRSSNLQLYRNNPRTFNLKANTNNWNIVGFGWASAGGTSRMSLNGTNGRTVNANQNGNSILAGGDFALAGEQDGGSSPYSFDPGQSHQGDFSEVIIFNTYINEAERIIVSNYLSAKYDITLNENNFYTQDTSGENFDHKVAGIGQAVDGSNHTDSQGTGIIRINTPSSLVNGSYLFWGEDVKDATYDFTTSADYKERLDTKWRVSKQLDLGSVTVSVDSLDLGDLTGKQPCATLNLVVSNTSTFTSPTVYPLTLDAVTNIYTATGVNFTDGDYFTIEYQDLIVLDGTQFYNGSGTSTANVPDITDGCFKLLVKSTADGTLKLTEDANVREVEVEAGGKLVVNTGFRLQVTDGLDIDGDVRLVGDAQLIQTHSGSSLNTGSGNLYKDQNSELTSVYRYNYWSSPVSEIGGTTYTVKGVMKNGTTPTSTVSNPADLTFTTGYDGSMSPLTLSSFWIYSYLNGEGNGGWAQKLETGSLNAGEGYLLKSPGAAQNYTFKGIPNDGDITFMIDADHTSLLGNPYPSAIDSDSLFKNSSNISALYFWEHKNESNGTGEQGHYTSGYIGGYGTRNATMGTAATSPVSGTAGLGGETYTAPGRYIPVGQGFFVQTGSGLAATVNFKNSQRFYETEAGGNSHFFKSSKKKSKVAAKTKFLKVGLEAKNSEDIYLHSQIGISFKEGNTTDFEVGFDTNKFVVNASDIYFKFPKTTNNLVIAGIGEITDDLEVPFTVQLNTKEAIYLMIDESNNINRNVFFKDGVTNIIYDATEPVKLELPIGTYENRFFITFSNAVLGTSEADVIENQITIFKRKQDELVVRNRSDLAIKTIKLYNLLGVEVKSYDVISKRNVEEIYLDVKKISKAIYFVSLKTDQGIINNKVIIE